MQDIKNKVFQKFAKKVFTKHFFYYIIKSTEEKGAKTNGI